MFVSIFTHLCVFFVISLHFLRHLDTTDKEERGT